jgi:hypothetical protein
MALHSKSNSNGALQNRDNYNGTDLIIYDRDRC